MAATSQALRISNRTLHSHGKKLRLGISEELGGTGAPLLVDAKRVAEAKSMLDDLVGIKGAVRILGCSMHLFKALVAVGALAETVSKDLQLPKRRIWSKASLQAWLNLMPGAQPESGASIGKTISLDRAIGILRNKRHALPDIVTMVQTGKLGHLRPCEGLGLRGLAVDQVVLDQIPGLPNPRGEGKSIECAARALGIPSASVTDLCHRGLLAGDTTPLGWRVSSGALELFAAEFFVPAAFERLGDRKERGWIASALIARGAVPVSGRSVDGGRQMVFKWADVRDIMPALHPSPLQGSGIYHQRVKCKRKVK